MRKITGHKLVGVDRGVEIAFTLNLNCDSCKKRMMAKTGGDTQDFWDEKIPVCANPNHSYWVDIKNEEFICSQYEKLRERT